LVPRRRLCWAKPRQILSRCIVINHSLRTAGDEIDEAIVQFARREYNLFIGERMAEKAKMAAGSAYPLDEEIRVVLRGRDLLTGLPKAVEVSSVELREGIAGPVNNIVQEVRAALEETPPELVADIMEYGIMLAGGGSLLHGLDKRIAAETKMPVHIADDPLSCVARGAGKMVEEFGNKVYKNILLRTQQSRRVKV
jgi:rod shape-determining protein MreB and related proteins